MAEIVVSLKLHIPYKGPETQEAITRLLQDIEEKVAAQGGTVEKTMVPVRSQTLLNLGLSFSDMFRLTAVGILGEDLLGYSEEQLCKMKAVDFSITFSIRRALRNNNHFLSGDSEENYRKEIIAYLSDVNGATYMRLRKKGITTLTQLAHALSSKTRDRDATTAASFIARSLGAGWQNRL